MGRIITRQRMGTLDKHVEILVPRYIYQGCHPWETGGGGRRKGTLSSRTWEVGVNIHIARLVDSFLVESGLQTAKFSVITTGIFCQGYIVRFEEFVKNRPGN